MSFLVALLAFLATLSGGLFALRFKDKLHLILGFSAGAVIGVAFFELIPEAIELGHTAYSVSVITSIMAASFTIYLILDRFFIFHCHSEEAGHSHARHRGILGAGSLAIHSFLDGVAVGLAFQVSVAAGAIVTAAVLVHDFSDGINTVNLILKNSGQPKEAFRWLLIDALAPAIGVISTLFFRLTEASLGLVLAIFSGFFLYIGASDLLPESHHRHPTKWTTAVTVAGVVTLYFAVRLVGV